MKIAITLIVDVDASEWAEEYGIDKEEVRDDVKQYVLTNVQQTAGVLDTGAEVRIR